MRKKLIKEAFNIANAKRIAKDGHEYRIAYIDPETSEKTFGVTNVLKKHRATFFSDLKTWGWFLGKNPESIYHQYIQPCLEELTAIEDDGEGNRIGQVTSIIDQLIQELSGDVQLINAPKAQDISDALSQFKANLMNCTSSEEFRERMSPIIKMQQALGHTYSFSNTLLIWIQDPDATMVKSVTGWNAMNKEVVDKKSRPIMLWRPDKEPLKPYQRAAIKSQFLTDCGVTSEKELNPGQKEELRVRLSGGKLKKSDDGRNKFKTYFAYDVRFTKQIEGKEDLVGSTSGTEEIKWFDDSTDQNEHLSACIDAGIETIKEAGITVEYETREQMGGALGMSCSNGVIKLLADADKTVSFFSTLVHELSHSLLHQRYVKDSKGVNSEWAEFFVGTSKGRGMVEQQAEISAYIVLGFFGYDTLETAANYAGCWGMDEKSAFKTFDSVAKVASFIFKKIGDKLSKSNIDNQEAEYTE